MLECLRTLREWAANLGISFADAVKLIGDVIKVIREIGDYPGTEDQAAWEAWAVTLSGAFDNLAHDTKFTQIDDQVANALDSIVADSAALDMLYDLVKQFTSEGAELPTLSALEADPKVQAIGTNLNLSWQMVAKAVLAVLQMILLFL